MKTIATFNSTRLGLTDVMSACVCVHMQSISIHTMSARSAFAMTNTSCGHDDWISPGEQIA
jgi:hypothetical protein